MHVLRLIALWSTGSVSRNFRSYLLALLMTRYRLRIWSLGKVDGKDITTKRTLLDLIS